MQMDRTKVIVNANVLIVLFMVTVTTFSQSEREQILAIDSIAE